MITDYVFTIKGCYFSFSQVHFFYPDNYPIRARKKEIFFAA